MMSAVWSGWTRTVAASDPPGSGSSAGRGVGRGIGLGSSPVSEVLRNGVLDAVAVCVAGSGRETAARCAALGAHVAPLDADLADEDAVAAAVAALGGVDVLVCETGGAFAAAGAGLDGL